MDNKISREELISIYQVEITFFDHLEASGLVRTIVENNTTYLLHEELGAFEKFANFYYDLEINMAGLEVINRLLRQIEELNQEKRKLNALMFKETDLWQDTE